MHGYRWIQRHSRHLNSLQENQSDQMHMLLVLHHREVHFFLHHRGGCNDTDCLSVLLSCAWENGPIPFAGEFDRRLAKQTNKTARLLGNVHPYQVLRRPFALQTFPLHSP